MNGDGNDLALRLRAAATLAIKQALLEAAIEGDLPYLDDGTSRALSVAIANAVATAQAPLIAAELEDHDGDIAVVMNALRKAAAKS